MKYRVTNHWGSVVVDEAEALEVWETWPAARRGGGPEHGFIVWDVSEMTGTPLMSTSYLPIPDNTD